MAQSIDGHRASGIAVLAPRSRRLCAMVISPFEEVELKICVSLLPSDIGDIYAGIRRNIYQFLMRYNETLGGVLLAVSELSFAKGEQEGRIMDEMPHIHFDVKAKAQVFRPQPGHILEGRVNKVTNTHVGMLVCGIFNASVASESMGEGFTYDMIAGQWTGARGQVIAVGGDTRFIVTRLHEAAGLISMEGSFEGLPEQQAAAHKRPAVMEEAAAAKSAKKKAKKATKAKAIKREL